MARATAPREQLSLLAESAAARRAANREAAFLQREKRRQKAILAIQKRYGKNAVLKGTNLQEGATTPARNGQIGGHRA